MSVIYDTFNGLSIMTTFVIIYFLLILTLTIITISKSIIACHKERENIA